MDGRVKTLHPRLYAGLLAVRDNPEHVAVRGRARHRVGRPRVREPLPVRAHGGPARRRRDAEVIENIDIGGPTMIRAAAKNHAFAAVVTSAREPTTRSSTSCATSDGVLVDRRRASRSPPRRSPTPRATTPRSRAGSPSARASDFPPLHVRAYEKVVDLPYGENPHQRAAYYPQVGRPRARARRWCASTTASSCRSTTCSTSTPRAGSSRDFDGPACVIVKHNNPCGAAVGGGPRWRPTSAPSRATRSAPSAASSRSTAASTARPPRRSPSSSSRCCSRPATTTTRSRSCTRKPNVRILEDDERRAPLLGEPDVRQVTGGLLVQDRDHDVADRDARWRSPPSARRPSASGRDLLFAWRVCKHVSSNAIVLARTARPSASARAR